MSVVNVSQKESLSTQVKKAIAEARRKKIAESNAVKPKQDIQIIQTDTIQKTTM